MTRYSENRLPEGWVSLFYGVTKHHLFMDLLNVKYEIAHAARWLALRETCLDRAFIVPGSMLLRKDEVLEYMAGTEFDPQKTILFEKEDVGAEPHLLSPNPSAVSGQVEITHYRPDRIALTVDTNQPSYLFLSEIFYPGWKALVDGKPVPILRGNYLFRVIELARGTHSVQFYYAPLTIKMGIAISMLTLVLITYVAISWFRRSDGL